MNVGERIKQRRKELKLTQTQLATKTGKATRTIQDYEAGKALPPIDVIKQIAKALYLSPGYLAYGELPISKEETQTIINEFKSSTINKFIQLLKDNSLRFTVNEAENIENITITIILPYNSKSEKITYNQNNDLTITVNYSDIQQMNTQTNTFFIYLIYEKAIKQ